MDQGRGGTKNRRQLMQGLYIETNCVVITIRYAKQALILCSNCYPISRLLDLCCCIFCFKIARAKHKNLHTTQQTKNYADAVCDVCNK